jgi:hypothetical protein
LSPTKLNEIYEYRISPYIHNIRGIKNDALYCAVCTHSLGATTLSHIAVVMVTDTLQIFGIYWTGLSHVCVWAQTALVDPFRAGKIKLLILFIFPRSFLVFGTLPITSGLLLLTPNSGTRYCSSFSLKL